MSIKRQVIGLILLLFMSAFSAVVWVVNVKKEQKDERIIQESTNLKFLFKEIRVSLYRSNTQVNNDEISNELQDIDKGLQTLILSLKQGSKEYSQDEITALRKKVSTFKYNVQRYQSSHAIIKNSVAYVHRKYALVLSSHSDNKNEIAMHAAIENVLFDYYADILDTNTSNFKAYKTESIKNRLLLLHVNQILKQYKVIQASKHSIDTLSLTVLQDSQSFISTSTEAIAQMKEMNKMMFISFVVTTIWLLIYGFASFIRAQKDYQKIRSLKNDLQQFVDALNRSAIVSKSDPKGTIIYVNDKFCEVSGYAKDELIGKGHNIVRHEDMPREIFTQLWQEIQQNKTFHALIKNKAKNGKPYYVDTHISAILDLDGNIQEYVAVRYDVTELVHTRDEALSAQKSKDKFLSTMSHELRTPLNAVIGFSELLQKSLTDPAYTTYINSIVDSAQDLLRLINDILDLAKIESGSFKIVNAPFNLEISLGKLIQRYNTQALESDITLECFCKSNNTLELYGDWLRISQVISNLLSNAIKFTLKKGTVQCSAFYENNELHIRVEDTGIGIQEEDLENVFSPFTQADDTTTRAYGGAGLGLSISKDLIEMMGGRFEVKSEVNVGSSFDIYIPLEICEKNKNVDAISASDTSFDFKGHVLVVEDNKTNQLMLCMMLEDLGLSSDVADNGQIAIDVYQEGKYDLILMDENMPVMGGTEAMQKLHDMYESLVPVIVVTANVVQGDREKFLEDGMDDYIPKPVNEKDLASVISKYLSRA